MTFCRDHFTYMSLELATVSVWHDVKDLRKNQHTASTRETGRLIYSLSEGWMMMVLMWKNKKSDRCGRRIIFHVCLSHSCEGDISGTSWRNVFRFGTNVHLHSKKNWLELERSEVKVTVTFTFGFDPQGIKFGAPWSIQSEHTSDSLGLANPRL